MWLSPLYTHRDNKMEKIFGEKHPYLICPKSGGDLYFIPETGNLYCNGSRTTYPVIQGMPVMISKPEFLNPSQGYYEGR